MNSLISLFALGLLAFTVGCSTVYQSSKPDLKYTVDWQEQIILDVNFDVEPLPTLEASSKLKIQVTPKISDIDIRMDWVTGDNYNLLSSNPIEEHILLGQTRDFEKNLEFTHSGPTGLLVILKTTLPNQINFTKHLHVYFYIPSVDKDNAAKKVSTEENISRVSKYPTKAHGPKRISE